MLASPTRASEPGYAVSTEWRKRLLEERADSWATLRSSDATRARRHAADTLDRIARLSGTDIDVLPLRRSPRLRLAGVPAGMTVERLRDEAGNWGGGRWDLNPEPGD